MGIAGGAVARRILGRAPSHLAAIPPPRGRPGEGPMDLPFHIEYLDAERLLPVLLRKAARRIVNREKRWATWARREPWWAQGRWSVRDNPRRNSHCAPTHTL